MQARPLTLHIRLTRSCNADCGYCSSWQESPEERLKPAELKKILSFIMATGEEALGISPTHITAQFLGGEIAMVPFAELQEHVKAVNDVCSANGVACVVGGQSNLIVSERKAAQLYDLFEGRLGTSIDLTSDTRTIKGDSDKYRVIWKSADKYLKQKRSVAGAIYVLEPGAVKDAKHHLLDSAKQGRAITFRPIFEGGIKQIQLNSALQMKEAMVELFDSWFMRMPIIAEPFFQLCESRLNEVSGLGRVEATSCAFQSDCTSKSINIDPNGDLHVCLEMADSGLPSIGNGLTGVWNEQAINVYSSRGANLSPDCQSCPYLKSCQGGCMYESIAQGQGSHGKSFHCASWKAIFGRIDVAIHKHGAEEVREWLHRIATRHANFRDEGRARGLAQHAEGVVSAIE